MDFEEEESDLSSLSIHQQFSKPYPVGFIIANIVDLKYYSGRINNQEMVFLFREPLNQHDPNAIKVVNTRSVQVGHIEQSVAAVLAPLLDSKIIFLECIIPEAPRNRNPFRRLPCQIHVFTLQESLMFVGTMIDEAGLSMIKAGNDHELSMSDSVAVKESENDNKINVDGIFKNVLADGNKKLVKIEANRDVVSTELFEHQKEALGWLTARENLNDLPPFWEEKGGLFLNSLTNHETYERPEPIRGGIFADAMGLGKTLTLLSLIANDRNTSTTTSTILGACKSKRKSNVAKKVANPRKKQKITDDMFYVSEDIVSPKATLIVCPAAVLSTWVDQLVQHTRRKSFKICFHHGNRSVEELKSHDIVLTTLKTLGSELGSANSPLLEIEWFRVIIDEAHKIKDFMAEETKAAIALKAERRWAVTGAPIQNNPSDLLPLMAFLRFHPFSIKSCWVNLVQRPFDQGNMYGQSRLHALIRSISLRRMKELPDGSQILVELPPKTLETCFVELSTEEREQYNDMESEAQNTAREYVNSDTVLRNYISVLPIILWLRKICYDISFCPPCSFSTIEDVSKSPKLLKKLASMVEKGDNFHCPVCLSPPYKTIITSCTHIFCQTCILQTLKKLKPCCPICRSPLTQSDLHLAPPTKALFSSSSTNSRPMPSKLSKLIQLLQASIKEKPSTKSVVFSQYRKMLILLEEPLMAAGFNVLRVDNSMAIKNRSEVLRKFGAVGPGAPEILLVSLKAAETGINLTVASRVYIVDPLWNSAVEAQAIDRVHRIGQKEEVRVVRLIVKDSIEERILKMQEKKKKLDGNAFGEMERRQMHVEEIRKLMQL